MIEMLDIGTTNVVSVLFLPNEDYRLQSMSLLERKQPPKSGRIGNVEH